MATEKRLTLITGANSGIGLALVERLLEEQGNHVLLGARSAEKGNAAVTAIEAKKLPGTVTFLEIDVSSTPSVEAAAKEVEAKFGRLDALVNNAGIAYIAAPPVDQFAAVLRTNTTGPWHVLETFAPLLRKGHGVHRVINVSSGMGSIELTAKDALPKGFNKSVVAYATSKTALNMVTTYQSLEYGPEGFKVFAYCPGFVESNLSSVNNAEGGAGPVSSSMPQLLALLNGERDAEHGKFVNSSLENGQWPW